MDTAVPKNHRKRVLVVGLVLILLMSIVLILSYWMPHGLLINTRDLRIAIVEHGQFLDDVVVRANAKPLESVILDAVESGRVEEVFVTDGTTVDKGAPLFRLSNPQRLLELLARQSDQATQISNLSNMRANLQESITDHERRIADLEFVVAQASKRYDRNKNLAEHGFISDVALNDDAEKLAQQRYALEKEIQHGAREIDIKRNGLKQMEQASARLESGLKLMAESIEALTVRAPRAGRLTDFHLQLGEGVTSNQHIGRIDDPSHFKLTADVDEYYLNRIAPGRTGKTQIDGKEFAIKVARVYPQIDKGRFGIDIVFTGQQPVALSPGQSTDVQIVLGDPATALLLPNDAFLNDSDGAYVYVLDQDEKIAEKRTIRLGRRSNAQVEVIAGLNAGDKVIVSGYTGFGSMNRLQLTKL